MHDYIHMYPLPRHPDSESQTHICVTKRSESQVNPIQSLQLLFGVHEVKLSPVSRADRNPTTLELHDNIADIQVGMEQGNIAYVIFEGELYIHFHHSHCSQQEWCGTVRSQISTDLCIRVLSPIKRHIKYSVHKI